MGPTEDISCKSTSSRQGSSESLLLGLPNELLSEVASHLESFKDLNSLVRTSRFFHGAFNPVIYRRAVAANRTVLDGIVEWMLDYRLASLTLLLDNGLSVNHTLWQAGYGLYKETMLRFLCSGPKRSVPLARLLIQRGANLKLKDHRYETVLYTAIRHSNYDMVALLLEHGAADYNATSLHATSFTAENKADMVHLLIAHGADIEARDLAGDTPLLSSSNCNHHVMAALLEHGADAGVHNRFGHTTLHWASTWFDSQHHELAKSLLVHGAVVNATTEHGKIPLHWVCTSRARDGGLFMANFLLENGADVNAISNDGRSPLHCAISYERGKAVVEMLLEHGAVIDATDESGHTPLHSLIKAPTKVEYKLDMAKLLLEKGANVNAVSNDGLSILQSAIVGEFGSDVVAILLEYGAMVDEPNASGQTPLHWLFDTYPGEMAIEGFAIVELLLDNGADVNAVSDDGLSVLQHALQGGHDADVVALLLEHGADVSVLDSEERRLLRLSRANRRANGRRL
jgi:ankyrin repeat protein